MTAERTRGDVAHLVRRLAFGATPERIDELAALGFDGAVDALTDFTTTDGSADAVEPPEFDTERYLEVVGDETADVAARREAQRRAAEERRALIRWWLQRMVVADLPQREWLTLAWHDHFATSMTKVKFAELMHRHYATLYDGGSGRFADLVGAVARDPAMLIWLDGRRNTAAAPNENFARELFELFTLGHGTGHHGQPYTEADVSEAARALTGWTIDRTTGTGALVPRRHDDGTKIGARTVRRARPRRGRRRRDGAPGLCSPRRRPAVEPPRPTSGPRRPGRRRARRRVRCGSRRGGARSPHGPAPRVPRPGDAARDREAAGVSSSSARRARSAQGSRRACCASWPAWARCRSARRTSTAGPRTKAGSRRRPPMLGSTFAVAMAGAANEAVAAIAESAARRPGRVRGATARCRHLERGDHVQRSTRSTTARPTSWRSRSPHPSTPSHDKDRDGSSFPTESTPVPRRGRRARGVDRARHGTGRSRRADPADLSVGTDRRRGVGPSRPSCSSRCTAATTRSTPSCRRAMLATPRSAGHWRSTRRPCSTSATGSGCTRRWPGARRSGTRVGSPLCTASASRRSIAATSTAWTSGSLARRTTCRRAGSGGGSTPCPTTRSTPWPSARTFRCCSAASADPPRWCPRGRCRCPVATRSPTPSPCWGRTLRAAAVSPRWSPARRPTC